MKSLDACQCGGQGPRKSAALGTFHFTRRSDARQLDTPFRCMGAPLDSEGAFDVSGSDIEPVRFRNNTLEITHPFEIGRIAAHALD